MIQIRKDFSLKTYNTFGIEGTASYFANINSMDDALKLVRSGFLKDKKYLILGGGSNVLFVDHYNGAILHNTIKGIQKIDEDKNRIFIEAGSGENWSDFVDYTVQQGWWGLENLSLIPGTVGAAPVQNIGAYGIEQQNSFYSLNALNLQTGEQKIFHRNECHFGYRYSIFKKYPDKWMILSVVYTLQKKGIPVLHYGALKEHFAENKEIAPKDISNYIKQIRRSKLPDPTIIGNGGSFFKNPEIDKAQFQLLQDQEKKIPSYPLINGRYKIPAGWLIEKCGWKGKRVNDAGVYPKQALVLVNYGHATGRDILNLAMEIKKRVFEKFRIELEPEVRIIL